MPLLYAVGKDIKFCLAVCTFHMDVYRFVFAGEKEKSQSEYS